MFRQYSEHKFAYDFPTLDFLLCRYGFYEVQSLSFGRSTLPELAIDSPDRASESLYVEALSLPYATKAPRHSQKCQADRLLVDSFLLNEEIITFGLS